ncbi:MAG TPA: hypothetical protein VFN55_16255 [Solirubrobacteraceae bacterium]|nr:hypothetical protein [Solirubrobacteraceae bacterium]
MPTIVFVAALTGGAAIAGAYPIAAQMWPVAGNGLQGYTGDGGPAVAAELNQPWAVATTPDGGYLIADRLGNVIRKVSAAGTITTVAGTGTAGDTGDGGAATSATLNAPRSVVAVPGGGYLIADSGNNVIREVSAAGIITTVAGTGTAGYTGDGHAAVNAELNLPTGVAPTADGGFLIADYVNQVIRKVSADGTITTVAGNGTAGFAGDGNPATGAELDNPANVAPTADGGFLIADSSNDRVRRVSASGIITTVAGNATRGAVGPLGGSATSAGLNDPVDVAVQPDGGYLIVEWAGELVAQVSPAGIITDVAGYGVAGDGGEGGPATAGYLNSPVGVAVTPDGGFLIADSGNSMIKWVVGPGGEPAGPAGPPGATGATGPAGAAGTPGATGAAGQTGPSGAQGQTGPAGANGRDGQIEIVSCRTVTVTVTRTVRGRRTRHKVTRRRCTTQHVTGTVRFTTADARTTRVQLLRAGRAVARGSVALGRGRVRLLVRAPHALAPGRYTLVLSRLRQGHRTITRTSVAVLTIR